MKYIAISKRNPNAAPVVFSSRQEIIPFSDKYWPSVDAFFEDHNVYELGSELMAPRVSYQWRDECKNS